MRKRVQDYQISFGAFPRGPHNNLTDIPGVKVGHVTIKEDSPTTARTGVTAIFPGGGDMFQEPIPAATTVINGYGKSTGLIQVDELGNLETPILLSNTMNVGIASDALIDYMLKSIPDCQSINPVVLECNDGFLNDIRNVRLTKQHVIESLSNAFRGAIEIGSVGAGTGMVCYEYKGGIGSASRIISLEGKNYTVAALVLTNFGLKTELVIRNQPIKPYHQSDQKTQDGSIIIVIGTDIPLDYRQLKRLTRRASFGIARTGGRCHHGSGEIALAFSTANRINRQAGNVIVATQAIVENKQVIDPIFDCVIDCIEESIIDSLFTSKATTGYKGFHIPALPVERLIENYSFE